MAECPLKKIMIQKVCLGKKEIPMQLSQPQDLTLKIFGSETEGADLNQNSIS
jgi:hypothetical protein